MSLHTIRASRSRSRRTRLAQQAASYDWWQAGGSIPEANCLEHVEFPLQRQEYAGAEVAAGQPWSIVFSTTWTGTSDYDYVWTSEDGNLRIGAGNNANRLSLDDSSQQLSLTFGTNSQMG